ncbi:MAG: hypothetical protein GXY83_07020 [Rhodopirellula sp.]|nr:hypothetical protein [Rhodopirellula sp.]
MSSLAAILLLLAPSATAAPQRVEVDLSGTWEFQLVQTLETPPDAEAWKPCRVPGHLRGHDYGRAWFRRSFAVPAEIAGKRVKLRFGGIKYHSRVLVNGKHVGGCFGGYQPFEVDITGAIRDDGPNELLVGCHDWTGLFSGDKIDFTAGKDWERIRSAPTDRILAPIGGLFDLYGIWDDVTLLAHPAVYVQDVFIQPSVRRGELVVGYAIANESGEAVDAQLQSTVEDEGRDTLRLPSASVRVEAGETASVTVRQAWSEAPHWSPADPHLLHLCSELSTGDRLRTRFGFREFWVEGHRFFLNGRPINLLATSWWPPHSPMTREEIRDRWQAARRCGCIAFRTHTQPWRSVHYDVADELGLLMIVEGAVWNDDYVYCINDPQFWNQYASHLKAMVDRDKNRPSVVMWSLENEFYGGRLNDDSPAKADLVRMGRLVKQCDPTRPILYESDGDPGGVADVIGIHYPHEYPDHTCWPNDTYWLSGPQKIGHMFHDGGDEFLWKKEKPLYIGEFLWIPSSDPSWHTVFFGDEAYRNYREYRDLAKARSWKMQILGYRHFEVGGISPWTVIEGGSLDESNPLYRAHQYAYQPIAAYAHDYDGRFYSGEEIGRRLEVFNDIQESSKLELRWMLRRQQEIVDEGKQLLELAPAAHCMLDVRLHLPDVSERTPLIWEVVLLRDGKQVFTDQHPLAVFPPMRLAAMACEVGLFDPKGGTRELFQSQGLTTVAVSSLARLPQNIDLLVVGAGAFAAAPDEPPVIGRISPERKAIVEFVARGGRVLVLEQVVYPEGLFDVESTGHASTMTFPAASDHPALRGVLPEDLKFWRGDHYVTQAEPPRPVAGSSAAIIVSGSRAGIDHAPLLEQSIGRGAIVYCQLKLVEKFRTEPAAARILANLLDDLSRRRPFGGPTAVVGGSDEYRQYLRSLGLRFDDLGGRWPQELTDHRLAVVRGDIAEGDIAAARDFVQQGGNLLIHRPSPQGIAMLSHSFGLDLAHQPYAGPVTRVEQCHPRFGWIAREDLYWLGEHVGIGWAETPRADGMADGSLGVTLEGKQVQTHEVEQWKLEGSIVEARAPGVTFATSGSASAELELPESARYVFGIVARGTPADGVWPRCRVSVDGETLGIVGVASDAWQTATCFGQIEKGRHAISIEFINDGGNSQRHEDRNLFVDKLLIARDDAADTAFLTNPPAVTAIPRGKGVLVLDLLRWDTEDRNARKAARYAGALLTSLGGNFSARHGVAIECETMTPQPDMPHFQNRGNAVSLACNGCIERPVRVEANGGYTVEILASGSSVEGVYPLVELRIDGEPVGQIQLKSGGWRTYPLKTNLTAGEHRLSLAFVNDLQRQGEDRNVLLDKATFYPE